MTVTSKKVIAFAVLLTFLSGSGTALAAISLNATSTSGVKSNVSSFTFSHTAVAGDTFLFLAVNSSRGSGAPGVATATYNGVAMTKVVEIKHDTTNPGDKMVSLWGLVSPTAGANTVSVTYSATVASSSGFAASFSGTDTGSVAGVIHGTSSISSNEPFPINVPVSGSGDYVLDGHSSALFCTVVNPWNSAYQVLLEKVNSGGVYNGKSYAVATSSASVNMGWDSACSATLGISAGLSIKPASAAVSTPAFSQVIIIDD